MRHRSFVCGAFAVLASLALSPSAWARELGQTVTIVEGESTIISGAAGYLAAPGVRLRSCDIVSTGPQALVQVELDDGGKIVLGPDSRMVFEVPQGGQPVIGPHILMSGWAKVTVPKRDKAPPYRIGTPHFDLLTDAGIAVVRIAAEGGDFFVEQGEAAALLSTGSAGGRVDVPAGRTYSRKPGQATGALGGRPEPAFVQGMPQSFRDTLPALLPQLKVRDVQPKPAPNFRPAETEEWLKSIPALRPCFTDVTVLGAQQALARNGFDVGPLDGIFGPRTQAAVREFQQQRGLTRSGKLDQDTLRALDVLDRR